MRRLCGEDSGATQDELLNGALLTGIIKVTGYCVWDLAKHCWKASLRALSLRPALSMWPRVPLHRASLYDLSSQASTLLKWCPRLPKASHGSQQPPYGLAQNWHSIASSIAKWSQQDSGWLIQPDVESQDELGEVWPTGDHLGNLTNTQFICQLSNGTSRCQWSCNLILIPKVFTFYFGVSPVHTGCLTLSS